MNILGISCFYHDSSACLIKDGVLIAAAQEERFNRSKYSEAFPINSINFCLQSGDISIYDVDYIGFYEKPFLKFSRIIISHIKAYPFSIMNFMETMPQWLDDRLAIPLKTKNDLGYEGKTLFIKHHLSHAASAFLLSPFEDSAILTVDGVGEFATASFGVGNGNSIKILKELIYPDSLGLLYAIVTTYLGFKVFEGEGKVMGLSAYGKPRFMNEFKNMVIVKPDGSFKLDHRYFSFNRGLRMYNSNFVKLLGNARNPGEKIEERHCDIAATLQKITEDILLSMANYIHAQTGKDRLCLAGGVFLNCVANSRILEEVPFKEIFIQPAAGDNGGALGVAYYIYNSLLGNARNYAMSHLYLGPSYSSNYIKALLGNSGLNFREFTDSGLSEYVAEKISKNKIVGWFQGRMEFGLRALGNRSILANPCSPDIKEILNSKVKMRESFRPYAPAVLEEKVRDFFEIDCISPFMMLAPKVKAGKKDIIPGVTHVDQTARLQTVSRSTNQRFWELINAFSKITGVPVLLNTSFNLSGEPIVCSPEDAINSFRNSNIDYLVLENYLLEK